MKMLDYLKYYNQAFFLYTQCMQMHKMSQKGLLYCTIGGNSYALKKEYM